MTRPLLAIGVLFLMNVFALLTGFLVAGLLGVVFALGFTVMSIGFGGRLLALS